MDTTQAYNQEVKRISKLFDIAIDAFMKHPPQAWSEEDFNRFIADLKKDKLRIETMDEKYASITGLKNTPFQLCF